MPADEGSHPALARQLIQASGTAALASLLADGAPFASHVITAPAADGAPLLLLSSLAVHSQNIARDPQASLLFVRAPEEGSDNMTAARLTLTGRVLRDGNADTPALFLARHPDAAGYAGFADFSYYRFEVEGGHLVAGFGRIVGLAPADLVGHARAA